MTKNNQKPNIIIILADDLGYSDLGCYGSEIKTPNIDNLGNNGIKFSQFYNPSKMQSIKGISYDRTNWASSRCRTIIW